MQLQRQGREDANTYNFIIVFAFSIKYLWHNTLHPKIDIPNNPNPYIEIKIARVVYEAKQTFKPAPVMTTFPSKFNMKKLPHVRSR